MPNSVDAADARAHDLQEVADVDAFLDVVGQVEVRVVELVGSPAPALRPCARRAPPSSQRRRRRTAPDRRDRERRTCDLRVMVVTLARLSEEHRERRRERRAVLAADVVAERAADRRAVHVDHLHVQPVVARVDGIVVRRRPGTRSCCRSRRPCRRRSARSRRRARASSAPGRTRPARRSPCRGCCATGSGPSALKLSSQRL